MNEEEDSTVDVWVNGDGGTWSCSPSILYQIPTSIFDHAMLLGQLNDKEDLDSLVAKVSQECANMACAITDIWVGSDGTWSGVPPVLFQIPYDVFFYLQSGDTIKTIGRLAYSQDLVALISRVRREIASGIKESDIIVSRTKPKNVELKACGHVCSISSTKNGCCSCLDLRPMQEEGAYPAYEDGVGWVCTATRSNGYCPHCS